MNIKDKTFTKTKTIKLTEFGTEQIQKYLKINKKQFSPTTRDLWTRLLKEAEVTNEK